MNKRKKPSQPRSIKTVQNILDTSRNILKNEGPLKFSTNLIAKKSGISVGSIYQYFQSKEKILEVLIESELQASLSQFDQKIGQLFDSSIEEKLSGVVSNISKLINDNDYLLQASKLFDLTERFNLDQFFELEIFTRSKALFHDHKMDISNKEIDQFLILIKQVFSPFSINPNNRDMNILSTVAAGMFQSQNP